VEAALAVLDRVMMALNAGDEPALLATLHFPHYRLAGGGIRVWDRPASYLGDFRARAGGGLALQPMGFSHVIGAGPAKVHLDVQFTRYRADNSVIGSYRYCGASPNLVDAGPWRAVELRGLAANHRTPDINGANELSERPHANGPFGQDRDRHRRSFRQLILFQNAWWRGAHRCGRHRT
jgi:hypothetical protein